MLIQEVEEGAVAVMFGVVIICGIPSGFVNCQRFVVDDPQGKPLGSEAEHLSEMNAVGRWHSGVGVGFVGCGLFAFEHGGEAAAKGV